MCVRAAVKQNSYMYMYRSTTKYINVTNRGGDISNIYPNSLGKQHVDALYIYLCDDADMYGTSESGNEFDIYLFLHTCLYLCTCSFE